MRCVSSQDEVNSKVSTDGKCTVSRRVSGSKVSCCHKIKGGTILLLSMEAERGHKWCLQLFFYAVILMKDAYEYG